MNMCFIYIIIKSLSKFALLFSFFTLCYSLAYTQTADTLEKKATTLIFKGQFSGWAGYSSGAELPLIIGGRYLPQLNLDVKKGTVRYDFEVAANVSGNGIMEPFSQSEWSGTMKLYRGWARISTDNAELRVGLQKINFGSATLLRPLMWFDRIDPRDPLQLTDGVWGPWEDTISAITQIYGFGDFTATRNNVLGSWVVLLKVYRNMVAEYSLHYLRERPLSLSTIAGQKLPLL